MNMLCCCAWTKVIDAIPCICWGILVLIFLIAVLRTRLIQLLIQNYHEREMKELQFEQEKEWMRLDKNRKEEDLNLEIRRFNELEINKNILDKVLSQTTEEKMSDLNRNFEQIKKDFENLKKESQSIKVEIRSKE